MDYFIHTELSLNADGYKRSAYFYKERQNADGTGGKLFAGEAKKAMKESQKEFAKTLASYADCYVMDAFGTAHRKHASTAVIADYFDADNKMLGYLMEKEVAAVDAVLSDIKRPFIAIMGGSKVSSKIGIIENLLGKVDKIILCGGMTYTFAKAHGGNVGNSICENDKLAAKAGLCVERGQGGKSRFDSSGQGDQKDG